MGNDIKQGIFMKVSDVYKYLDTISPFNTQEDWDNSGLLVSNDDTCKKIYLSLDLDLDLLESLQNDSLIITHHPLIFKAIKKIDNSYIGNAIKLLIKKNCALIAMHTNYDLSHLNTYFIEEILEKKIVLKEGFLAYFKNDFESIEKLADFLKERLKLKNINITYARKNIKSELIGVCTGSAISLAKELKSNIFLTGDIKYHDAFILSEENINLIDIKHFNSEECFAKSMATLLQKLPKEIIIKVSKNPFSNY